jgi:formate hydrogenlyase transcriptional activator
MRNELLKKISNTLLLDCLPGLVYVFDKDGRLLAWNKKTEEVYKYNSEELYGRNMSEFIDPGDREKVGKAVQDIFTGGFAQIEMTTINKSGQKMKYLGSGKMITIEGEMYLVGLGLDISELISAREKIKEQLHEISRLNELLKAENIYLKDQVELHIEQSEIIGKSQALKYILFRIEQVAPTDASVLIEGETGTGKELIARAIHRESKRSSKPFIKVNCASIPESLIESELFGHEKGAFTGAFEKRIGRFEIADGGTIFLDEIGELTMNVQAKLLHILQQGEFERIGSSKTIKTDVRVIAATNKVLKDEIKKGHFRSDLYYRINVFPITVLPLRDRKDDIPPLVEYYAKFYSEKINKPLKVIPKATLKRLIDYDWPGNVRELENVIERGVITSMNHNLNIELLTKSENILIENITLEELERNYITTTLEKTFWKISGKGSAAEILNLNPDTLRSRMRKLGIKREIIH